MRPSVWFLGGWIAAYLAIAATAFGWPWVANAGAGRHIHHHKTTPPRGLPDA